MFWRKISTSITGGAILIAFFSIIAKIVGLFRDRLLASTFGAGQTLDVYYASFRLPDFIFNTLMLGAFAAAFIPVFIKTWSANKEEGQRLINSLLNFFIITMLVLVGIGIALAPTIIDLITPGFSSVMKTETVELTRIMLLSIVFFAASNIFSSVLNAWRKFFLYSLAPIFYNIGIISGIIFIVPYYGQKGLAWGVLLGAFLHMIAQLSAALYHGWRWQAALRFSTEVKKIFTLMIPRTIGLGASQIEQVVIMSIASTLSIGSIAIFNLANNLQSFPVSIFGISMAIATFPIFSQAIADQRMDHFRGCFGISWRKILFVMIPLSVMILVTRAQIVRLFLGSGQFDWEDTYYTAQVLGVLAVSLFAQGSIPLLARAFYSLEDTKTPLITGVISVFINIVLGIYLSQHFGIIGLGISFSLANIFNMLTLLFILRERIGDLDDHNLINAIIKMTINSFLMGLVIYGLLHLLSSIVNMHTFLGIFLQASVALTGGLITYLLLAYRDQLNEWKMIMEQLKKFLPKNRLKENHE